MQQQGQQQQGQQPPGTTMQPHGQYSGATAIPQSEQQQQQQQQPGVQAAPPFVAQPKKPRRKVLTSLTLEVLVYFGGWWDVIYYVLNILVFVYKGLQLPYPSRNFAMEFCFAWLWFIIEIPRLFLTSKGNKTERSAPMFFALGIALPLLGMYIYFIDFQTYVLKIDLFLNGVAIGFLAVQVILSFIQTLTFMMTTKFAA